MAGNSETWRDLCNAALEAKDLDECYESFNNGTKR